MLILVLNWRPLTPEQGKELAQAIEKVAAPFTSKEVRPVVCFMEGWLPLADPQVQDLRNPVVVYVQPYYLFAASDLSAALTRAVRAVYASSGTPDRRIAIFIKALQVTLDVYELGI